MRNLTILFLTLLFACQQAAQNDNANLKDEVMAIHDEVMPKMGELRRVRKELLQISDSIMANDSTRAQLLDQLASDIDAASEGMMQWMRAYEPDFQGSEEEIQNYLQDQKKSIQEVKDQMESSLEAGKKELTN